MTTNSGSNSVEEELELSKPSKEEGVAGRELAIPAVAGDAPTN